MPDNEQIKLQTINIPDDSEPSHGYRNIEAQSEESLVTIQTETTRVSKQPSQNQLITRYFFAFLVGIIFTSLVLLLFNFFWNHILLSVFENSKTEPKDHICHKRVVGYYAGTENRKITEKQIEKLTHIIFTSIEIKSNGFIYFGNNERKQLFLDMKNKAIAMKSDVKVMFSTDYTDNANVYSNMVVSCEMREIWIDSITSFIIDHQLDGVELYYRWPKTKMEKENYVLFCRELRYKFQKLEKSMRRKVPYLISVLSTPLIKGTANVMDLEELLQYADFLNIETDNYYAVNGPKGFTGPMAPLYSMKTNRSIDWTFNAYNCLTKMPSRLNMLISFRGVYWKNVGDSVNEIDELFRNVKSSVGMRDEGGILEWRLLQENGWNQSNALWHEESKTPYIWDSKNQKLLTFENERSLKEKMKYIMEKNLGGITIYEMEYDDDENTLLNALTSIDLCSGEKLEEDEIKYTCENMET